MVIILWRRGSPFIPYKRKYTSVRYMQHIYIFFCWLRHRIFFIAAKLTTTNSSTARNSSCWLFLSVSGFLLFFCFLTVCTVKVSKNKRKKEEIYFSLILFILVSFCGSLTSSSVSLLILQLPSIFFCLVFVDCWLFCVGSLSICVPTKRMYKRVFRPFLVLISDPSTFFLLSSEKNIPLKWSYEKGWERKKNPCPDKAYRVKINEERLSARFTSCSVLSYFVPFFHCLVVPCFLSSFLS